MAWWVRGTYAREFIGWRLQLLCFPECISSNCDSQRAARRVLPVTFSLSKYRDLAILEKLHIERASVALNSG